MNLRWPSPSNADINELALHSVHDPLSLRRLSSVIFLTPPADDMKIHVSARLTMSHYIAIKKKKKKSESGRSGCLSLSCLLIDDKENDWKVLDSGAGGDGQWEFNLLCQIFQKETCTGIWAPDFSYCITLIKTHPSGTYWTECCSHFVQVKTKMHPSKMSLSCEWYQLSCCKWSEPLH